jgi:hypothetical protein
MNLPLLYNTVKNLKRQQIVYQVYYRLAKVNPLGAYSKDLDSKNVTVLSFSKILPALSCATADAKFTFLNKEVQFGERIDWGFQANGKLWYYNLQYGNYLLQENIPLTVRLSWLTSLHGTLYNGNVLLEPYPVSLRVMNSIRLFSRYEIKDERLLNALHAEVNFLCKRVEYHLLGNHVLENAFALLMGGAFFNNNRCSNLGQKLLIQELEEQVLSDGGHYELSPMYHQIILYRVLEFIDWYGSYQNRESSFLETVVGHAVQMLAWLKNITFTNNQVPYLNDSAPNIAYDTASLLKYATHLGLDTFSKLPLADSGYRKYQFGKYECVVDVAPIGPSYQSGHGHADALSFILFYKSAPLFVEAGTSTYEIGSIRDYERSTAAHNTVVLDNTNQSEVWGGFRVGERATVNINYESANRLEASHNGYKKRLNAVHKRAYDFEPTYILIMDTVFSFTS